MYGGDSYEGNRYKPCKVSTNAAASAPPPKEISPSPTTSAGEYAPRLMLRGRATTEAAAPRMSILVKYCMAMVFDGLILLCVKLAGLMQLMICR